MNGTMKFLKLILILVLPTLFFSCNPDRDLYTNGNGQTYGIIDANINGYTWSAMSGYAQFQNFTLYLHRTGPNNSTLDITIYPYNGVGTYSANSPASILYYDVDGIEYSAVSGSVTVSSDFGGQVEGSFAFSAVANGGSTSIDMTGSFNLYQ
jgi:hypothetical protein